MLRKFKDRVKLGVSPSTSVIDWNVDEPFPIKKKEDDDKIEPTLNPADLEDGDNAQKCI